MLFHEYYYVTLHTSTNHILPQWVTLWYDWLVLEPDIAGQSDQLWDTLHYVLYFECCLQIGRRLHYQLNRVLTTIAVLGNVTAFNLYYFFIFEFEFVFPAYAQCDVCGVVVKLFGHDLVDFALLVGWQLELKACIWWYILLIYFV